MRMPRSTWLRVGVERWSPGSILGSRALDLVLPASAGRPHGAPDEALYTCMTFQRDGLVRGV
jgi:hypothetical protein